MCKAHEVSSADIEEALEFETSGSLAYNASLFLKYESEMRGLLADKDGEALLSTLTTILGKTLSSNVKDDIEQNDENSGILGGFLNKIKTK